MQTILHLDMILEMGVMPLITKATRITDHTATLIDHIYTNLLEKIINAAICTTDITDHLPVFCTIANKLPEIDRIQYSRDFSNLNKDMFLNDIKNINFSNLISEEGVNVNMNNIIDMLQDITVKHAPVCRLSNKKRKRKNKTMDNKRYISLHKTQTKTV